MTSLSADPARASRAGQLAPAAGMLALLVGPPIALAALAGWPVPTAGQLHVAIELRWLSRPLAIELAACAGWLIWGYIAAAVGVEAAAQIRHRQRRLPLPVGLAQLVHAGVAAAVMSAGLLTRLTPAAAVPTPPPTAVTAAAVAQPNTASPTPAAAARETAATYTVRRYDTLWDIADAHYGDPLAWHHIWHANAGRMMNTGQRFSDPNLIRPGWHLQLPTLNATPTDPATTPTQRAAPHAPVPDPTPPAHQHDRPAPAPPTAAKTARPPASGDASKAGQHGRTRHDQHQPPAEATGFPALPVGLGLGVGAVGLAAALDVHRRRARRRRRPGRRIPLPTDGHAAAERALRHSGPAADAELIGGTLRLAAAVSRSRPARPPLGVAHHRDGVELLFGAEVPPAPRPFTDVEGGWLLPTTRRAALFAADGAIDPVPALARVGTDGPTTFYLNLEAYGALAVDGPGQAADALRTAILTDLAGAPWADLTWTYSTTALPAALAARPHVEHRPDLCELLEHLRRSFGTHPDTETSGGVAAARMSRAEGDLAVHLIAAAADDPAVDQLLAQARDPASETVALLAGCAEGADTLSIDADGRITLPRLGRSVAAAGVHGEQLTAVAELIEQADGPDVAPDTPPYDTLPPVTPPASGTPAERTAANQTRSGPLPPDDADTRDDRPDPARPDEPPSGDPADEEHADDTPREPPAQLIAVAAAELARPVDPTTTGSGEVEVLLLGEVDVRGTAGPLTGLQKEITAYLATHPDGVDIGKLTAALWPELAPAPKTVHNRVHELRDALGEDRISRGPRYRLAASVSSDWARFQALAAGDVADRQHALSLIRGEPLVDIKHDWVDAEGHRPAIESVVVDVAAALAGQLLAEGDPAGADQAADAGVRAGAYAEQLYVLGMRAAAATGNVEKIHKLYQRLAVLLDLDADEQVNAEITGLRDRLIREARHVGTS